MKLAGIIFLVVALPYCSKIKENNPSSLRLKECGRYVYNGETTRLCFDSVVSDSRCPANVVCVWEGTAVAKFSFHKNNEAYSLTLATRAVPTQFSKDTIVAGYKIEFINLLPYPGTVENPLPKNARAEVKVTRL
ncbi:MAG TPA: hypothetical protein VF476_00190 [Chitinophagaceae bacterium]